MESATCIVALKQGSVIWIGGDAATTSTDGDLSILSNKKVFNRIDKNGNNWLFGFTGAFRFAQLLQYNLELPELDNTSDLLGELVRNFIPKLRSCLHDQGFEQIEKNRVIGGTCIIGLLGRIFEIGSQYSVTESTMPYHAIGCAKQTALGSLFSTKNLEAKERIELALAAAAEFNWAVRGPFEIISA